MSEELADTYWKDIFNTQCPRCGVQYVIKKQTIKKRAEREGYEGADMWYCRDCRPLKPRKGRITGLEVWAAYAKEKGLQ